MRVGITPDERYLL